MLNLSIDYGRSSVKYAKEGTKGLFSSAIYNDPEEVNKELSVGDVDYIKVRFNGEEYAIGDLALEYDGVINTANYDDIESDRAKIFILTAIGLLGNGGENIKLMTTLSADQYNNKKEEFGKQFEKKNFSIDVYDSESDVYDKKEFYIKEVYVRQQGFYAFMNHLLNRDGSVNISKSNILDENNLVIDIGEYSTDLYATKKDKLERIKNVDIRIPGMRDSIDKIRQKINSKYSCRLENYEVLNSIQEGFIRKGNDKIKIDKIINNEYSSVANIIVENVKDKINFTSIDNVQNILLCGGGARPLKGYISNCLKREVSVIDNPRFANCLGGLKAAKMDEIADE